MRRPPTSFGVYERGDPIGHAVSRSALGSVGHTITCGSTWGGLMTASHQPDARWKDWRIALQPIPAFVGWYRENKISGTLLITAFVIVKGYVVARGDITTALGIVRYVGVAGWVVAAVLSSLPTLAAAMLAICFYQIFWPLVGRQLANWR